MKKYLLLLCALLLTAVGASAQSVDVTETYVQNPSFEEEDVDALEADGTRAGDEGGAWAVSELTGWDLTLDGTVDVCDLMSAKASATDNNLGVPSAAADGTYWLYLKKTWGNDAGSASVKQTVTLPAGTYKLTVQSMAVDASATANLVAGEASTAIVINGTSATQNILTTMAWTTDELKFTVTPEEGEETAEVVIGLDVTFPTGANVGSFLFDNFKLYEVHEIELTAHECETDKDHWEISGNTNGVFQLDDWSGTASTLTAPVLEYWIYNVDGNLSAATISHNTLIGMPAGTYEVSIVASATAENTSGSVGTGTTFNANGVSVDMTTGTAGTRNYHGTYTVEATVGEEGTLDISFTIPSGATYNWIAFQNLSVVMIADDYPTVAPLEGDMDEDVKEAMEAAIVAYEDDPSSATFNAAIDAIQDAYVAIQKYGEIHECEAEFDHWSSEPSINGDYFHANTWSTEADPSGMHNPFIEYWYGSGNALDDAVISHETITGTPGAIYSVSIDYRAFNEYSTKVVSQGSTFNANETSADLCVGTRAVFNDVSEEEYAIGYTMLCQADEDGNIDINFTIKDADYDWLAFKNLIVKEFNGEWPELTAATGDMHDGYNAAQTSALAAYAESPSFETYLDAFNAVNAAHLSALFYEDIAETLAELDLDAAGQAAFSASENGVAYEAKTLEYCDMAATFAAAVKAQTTSGKDITYAMENSGVWTGNSGFITVDGLSTAEAYANEDAGWVAAGYPEGKVLYMNIDGLIEGATYEVSFYAEANTCTWHTSATGTSIAQVFANDEAVDITVTGNNTVNGTGSWATSDLHTFTCTVGDDGVLEFGLQNVAQGGSWYTCSAVSLTLIALADVDSDYHTGDVVTVDGVEYAVLDDNEIYNHSFELGFTGWTKASDFTTTISEDFELRTDAPQNGDNYLVGTSASSVSSTAGGAGTSSLGTAWPIEAGATYMFTYWLKQTDMTQTVELNYLVTSLTNTPGTETDKLAEPTISEEWQPVQYVFTNDEGYEYLQIDFRWLKGRYGFDNFSLHKVEATGNVAIDWDMTEAGWGTLILPFDVEDVPSGLTLYAGSALTVADATIEVGDASESIEANTPYLVSGAEGTYTFTGAPTNDADAYTVGMLTGTLVDMTQDDFTADGSEYVLQNHEDEGLAFYPIISGQSEDVTLNAYHCYLTYTGAEPAALRLPGMATAIEAVESDLIASDAIYDLSGRKVSKAVKGIYIMNGKKVLVK